MDIRFEKTKSYVLAWCIEDWTPLFFIEAFVEEFYGYEDLELNKKTTLKIIENMLDEKLIVAGDLLPGNKFKIWNKKTMETLLEIRKKWDNLNRELHPHEIVWFDITEKGKKEFEFLNNLPELKDDDE
jgi:hypothetical protein